MDEEPAAAAAGGGKRGMSKFLNKSKDRWKEKLSSNLSGAAGSGSGSGSTTEPPLAAKAQDSNNFTLSDDVADFLKPSTSRSRPISPRAPPRIGLDIAAAQNYAAAPAPGDSLPTPSSLVKKDYPRRALRLAVQFSYAEPEVIGEGGEEFDEPVIEISKRLEQSGVRRPRQVQPPKQILAHPAQGLSRDPGRHELEDRSAPALAARALLSDLDLEEPPSLQKHDRHNSLPTDEPDFVPKPIKRTQTTWSGLESEDDNLKAENVRPSFDSGSIYSTQSSIDNSKPFVRRESHQSPGGQSMIVESPLQVRTTRLEDLRFGGKRNSLHSPILQEKIHKMRAEEGKALHSAVEQDPFLDNFGTSNRVSTSTVGSVAQPADELSPRGSISQGRSMVQDQQFPSHTPSGFQNQPPNLAMPIPSPGYNNQPTPSIHPHTAIPPRKALATSPMTAQLRPSPTAFAPVPSPRMFPALNVSIPNKADYFQGLNSGPPSRASDRSNVQEATTGASQAPSYTSATAPASRSSSNATPPTYTTVTAPASRSSSNATPGAALGQLALDDFIDRCSHMGGIFRLQAEYDRPLYEYTPLQWVRAATWWFLRGRAGIEHVVRNRPRTADGRSDVVNGQELLTQPHVDLAKTWWILSDVIDNYPSLRSWTTPDYGARLIEASKAGDQAIAELFEACEILVINLKSVLASMKRNGVMPPTHALIQGQDQSIWLRYPDLSPALQPILAGASGRALTEGGKPPAFSALSVMAVADTRLDFSYSRSFVTALLGTDDPDIERIPLPALVSVMRERNDWHPKLTICAQKEIMTLCIQGDQKRGPSWQDVKWSESNRSLLVCLPHGYSVEIQLHESEFRPLFNLYNHTFRVQSSLLPLANEKIVYETSLVDFQYKDSRSPPAFPTERVKRCRIRIFAKAETRFEGNGERKLYKGFRVLAVTSPKNRILGSASHDIGLRYPTLVSEIQDAANPGLPALVLYTQEDRRQCSALMVFSNEQDSRMLLDTLNGFVLSQGESQAAAVRLKSLSIESSDQAEAFSASSRNGLAKMRWTEVLTLGRDSETPLSGPEGGPAQVGNLRVVAQAAEGTVTDRLDVGQGELVIRLSPDGGADLSMLRGAQESLSITLDPGKAPQTLPNEAADIQRTVFMLPTIRVFSFHTLDDLHTFQASITSFRVMYDGLAQAFNIARRRPVTALSRHKKVEAGITRLQIVSHERQRIIQLLAFFDDMPQADCLNFQLKGVDEFERCEDKHSRGRYGVKLVDAKFTLPMKEAEEKMGRSSSRSGTPVGNGNQGGRLEKRFVSLDVLEPPAENDDIVIGFADEAGKSCVVLCSLLRFDKVGSCIDANIEDRTREVPRRSTCSAAGSSRTYD